MAPSYRADLFARVVDGVQERTAAGAVVTLCSLCIIASLVFLEVRNFASSTTVHHIGVDDGDVPYGRARVALPDRMTVHLHMTFLHLGCDELDMHVDATRGDKESQNHVEFRAPTAYELSKAPGGEVGQGCTLDGRLSVGKVSANFRIVASMKHPAAVLQATNPLLALQDRIQSMDHLRHANVSHVVHSMHFGERFPGMAAPLDGVVQHLAAGQQHYMLKIIPTIHDRFPRKPISTNQYALSEQFISHELVMFAPNGAAMDPGVYFFYDFFPVMIQIVQNRPGFASFMTSICAIVGGVFAISSIVDGAIFRSMKAFSKAD